MKLSRRSLFKILILFIILYVFSSQIFSELISNNFFTNLTKKIKMLMFQKKKTPTYEPGGLYLQRKIENEIFLRDLQEEISSELTCNHSAALNLLLYFQNTTTPNPEFNKNITLKYLRYQGNSPALYNPKLIVRIAKEDLNLNLEFNWVEFHKNFELFNLVWDEIKLDHPILIEYKRSDWNKPHLGMIYGIRKGLLKDSEEVVLYILDGYKDKKINGKNNESNRISIIQDKNNQIISQGWEEDPDNPKFRREISWELISITIFSKKTNEKKAP